MRPFVTGLVLLSAFPVAALELSYFQAEGRACVWRRGVRPDDRTVATFDGACGRVRSAWNTSGGRVLIVVGDPERLFEVDAKTGEKRELPLPGLGTFDEAGYDVKGRILALGIQPFDGDEVTFEGTRYVANKSYIGAPALAHAFALEHGKWVRLETKVTGSEACSAPHTHVLASWALIVRPPVNETRAPTKSELARLQAAAPVAQGEEGAWQKVGEVFAWMSVFGDYDRPTGRIALERKGKMQLLTTGLSTEAPVQVDSRRETLLVADGERVLLVDMASGATLFTGDRVAAAELR